MVMFGAFEVIIRSPQYALLASDTLIVAFEELLSSNTTLSTGVGKHSPGVPPEDKDQWVESDHSPLSPTQKSVLLAEFENVIPEFEALSKLFEATMDPLETFTFLNMEYETL
jgi:hypothetical protein